MEFLKSVYPNLPRCQVEKQKFLQHRVQARLAALDWKLKQYTDARPLIAAGAS
jgi:hypothetical protein